MSKAESKFKNSKKTNPKVHRTILDDLRKSGLKRSLRRDLKDIYLFYLDREMRQRLSSMNRFKRWFMRFFWLLKSLILKLTPVRRILLVISLYLTFIGPYQSSSNNVNITFNFRLLGFTILLLILMLELKDKLLARDELEAGRAVQFSLLPDQNPELPGWDIWMVTHPANEVGGDLVDYLHCDDGRLGLILGDVAGKGLGAALYMAKLQATYRALAPSSNSLPELGSEMNKIFCRDGLPSRFISIVSLELKPNDGWIRVLNTGHLPPISIQKGKIQSMSHGAPALGIMSKPSYKEQRIKLNKGDLLLIYSDGLTEAQDEKGEFFGEESLADLLLRNHKRTAESIGETILDTIKQFVGDAPSTDDLSMIILKRVD